LQGHENAKEAFLRHENELKLYCERDKILENAFVQAHALQIFENDEPEILEEEEEHPYQQMTDDQYNSAHRTMNLNQREILML